MKKHLFATSQSVSVGLVTFSLNFPTSTFDMKIILLNIAFLLLALTINLQTASSDKLRAPEPEEPTDVS
ncbi:hypothetical protein TrRE_jg1542, partial [Triparma retinervis]